MTDKTPEKIESNINTFRGILEEIVPKDYRYGLLMHSPALGLIPETPHAMIVAVYPKNCSTKHNRQEFRKQVAAMCQNMLDEMER